MWSISKTASNCFSCRERGIQFALSITFSTFYTQIDTLTAYHKYVPTFALSSGLRMWIKLIMSENFLDDDKTPHVEFKVEVRYENDVHIPTEN